jgi:hypothetical protein
MLRIRMLLTCALVAARKHPHPPTRPHRYKLLQNHLQSLRKRCGTHADVCCLCVCCSYVCCYTYAASPQSSKRCGKRWGCPCLRNHGMREREREMERETETDAATETDRQTESARERASERARDKQQDRQTEKERRERESGMRHTHPKNNVKKRNVLTHCF